MPPRLPKIDSPRTGAASLDGGAIGATGGGETLPAGASGDEGGAMVCRSGGGVSRGGASVAADFAEIVGGAVSLAFAAGGGAVGGEGGGAGAEACSDRCSPRRRWRGQRSGGGYGRRENGSRINQGCRCAGLLLRGGRIHPRLELGNFVVFQTGQRGAFAGD